ncbi:unnamed protein product [Miscanthus lutarioriparius]|uniref:C2HC zinc finger plants domain-containing protein n=1 Tax=Miscanthus lutarioriparius TaxID=422564 RepID=A0A811PXI0_9POAL|nr:unnamed protein product [Miscanthus lutarioriparius]
MAGPGACGWWSSWPCSPACPSSPCSPRPAPRPWGPTSSAADRVVAEPSLGGGVEGRGETGVPVPAGTPTKLLLMAVAVAAAASGVSVGGGPGGRGGGAGAPEPVDPAWAGSTPMVATAVGPDLDGSGCVEGRGGAEAPDLAGTALGPPPAASDASFRAGGHGSRGGARVPDPATSVVGRVGEVEGEEEGEGRAGGAGAWEAAGAAGGSGWKAITSGLSKGSVVLLAIRSQGGEQALMQTMNRARELYAQRLQATPSVDELASLLAQCNIAEAQSTNTNPSQGPGSDPVDMLNSDETCILAESGRKQIILDAFADGSSFICLKCGGLFSTSRKDKHLAYWCGTA